MNRIDNIAFLIFFCKRWDSRQKMNEVSNIVSPNSSVFSFSFSNDCYTVWNSWIVNFPSSDHRWFEFWITSTVLFNLIFLVLFFSVWDLPNYLYFFSHFLYLVFFRFLSRWIHNQFATISFLISGISFYQFHGIIDTVSNSFKYIVLISTPISSHFAF